MDRGGSKSLLVMQVRYSPDLLGIPPVSLHANYHADKLKRLLAAESWWVKGDKTELMAMEVKS